MPNANPYLPPSLQAHANTASSSVPSRFPRPPHKPRGPVGIAIGTVLGFVSAAGFTACLVVLLKVMLEVTSQGGFCARGGPYQVVHECSDQAAYLPPIAIVGMLLFVGIGSAARGTGYLVAALAWPALFCTLGGGFIYSARFPEYSHGVAYVVGGMFLLMGGIPLLLLIRGIIRNLVRGRSSKVLHTSAVSSDESASASPISTQRSTAPPVFYGIFNLALLGAGVAMGMRLAELILTR